MGAFGVAPGSLEGSRIAIDAYERCDKFVADAGLCVFLDVEPAAGLVTAQSLEAEWPGDSRGHAQGNPCGFDQNRSASAEWIEQGAFRVPPGEGE